MLDLVEQSRHYRVIAQAIRFVRSHARRQPGLEEIADAVHMSPHHLQRVFSEWAGISPKRFLQYVTKEFARQRLGAAQAGAVEVVLQAERDHVPAALEALELEGPEIQRFQAGQQGGLLRRGDETLPVDEALRANGQVEEVGGHRV